MILVDYAPILPELFSLGLMGVGLVSWLGDEGSDEVDQDGDGGDEFDMEQDEDFGMDDFDEDFGGMDDMDGMDDSGNGATSTEMENRIEDLESEIANVSSTANTVRSENEQISEKVDDVEENVRKLLEIYEMVTRGVNPFVDDVSPEAGMGGGGGSDFGLFGEEEDDTVEETEADLGSDIADAEAEDFFEDDAFDDDFEDAEDPFESEEDGFDEEFDDDADLEEENGGGGSEDDGLEDEFGDFAEDESMNGDDLLDDDGTAAGEPDGDSSGDAEGGTSFEELKAEYESGDAEWAEGDEAPTDPTDEAIESETRTPEPKEETEDLFHQDDLEDENTEAESGVVAEADTSTAAAETEAEEPLEAATESTESPMDAESADSAMGNPQANQADAPKSDSDSGSMTGTAKDSGFQFGAATTAESADQPHLPRPPNGYLADVVLMEWLEFLVTEFDARNAIRAINHYERIGWIGEPMRDHCFEVLQGITDRNYPYRDESGPTDLTMDDHRRSLRYVEDLATGHLDRELGDRITSLTTHGVQR